MRTQQECILSGGVYLLHRPKDNLLPFLSDTLYHNDERRARSVCWRAGVQEAIRFFAQDVRFFAQDVRFVSRKTVTR